jgi:hypothetical protein
MTRMRIARVALCTSAVLLCARAAHADGAFVFVRNDKNTTTRITNAALRDLLMGHSKKWPSGPAVQLVLRGEESEEFKWIAAHCFSTSAHVLNGKIRQEVFKGELRSPQPASSDEETIAKVKASDGGLGVLKEGSPLPPGVSVLTVVD